MTKHLDTPIKKTAARHLLMEKKKAGAGQWGLSLRDTPNQVMIRKLTEKKYSLRRHGRRVVPDALASLSKIERRALIAALAAIRDSDNTHFTLIIDRKTDFTQCIPQSAPPGTAEQAEEKEFNDAMAAALERGRTTSARLLSGPDMLTSDQFAALLGVSRETVNRLRARHELLGLQGAKRGFKYPDWQIVDGRPLKGLPQLHALMHDSPWAVYRFLLEEHDSLGGRRALDLLKKGRVEIVLQAAEALNWGTG